MNKVHYNLNNVIRVTSCTYIHMPSSQLLDCHFCNQCIRFSFKTTYFTHVIHKKWKLVALCLSDAYASAQSALLYPFPGDIETDGYIQWVIWYSCDGRIKFIAFWVMTPWSFIPTYKTTRRHYPEDYPYPSEKVCSPETLVPIYQNKRRLIPKDRNLGISNVTLRNYINLTSNLCLKSQYTVAHSERDGAVVTV
jgi:hypothetical protein